MRSYNRFIVDEEIECFFDGTKDMVQIYNLSSGGCMIEVRGDAAQPGTSVSIVLGDLGRHNGTIVWRVERNAGIKFDVPLHTKVVEQFGFDEGADDFDEADPRDRFGLPLLVANGTYGAVGPVDISPCALGPREDNPSR